MVINVELKKMRTIMKKTYINPEMEIVKVTAMHLLAGSDPQLGGDYNPGSDPVLGREDNFDFE